MPDATAGYVGTIEHLIERSVTASIEHKAEIEGLRGDIAALRGEVAELAGAKAEQLATKAEARKNRWAFLKQLLPYIGPNIATILLVIALALAARYGVSIDGLMTGTPAQAAADTEDSRP